MIGVEKYPFDSWALARLRVGHDLNGKLGLVSESNRDLAERMAQVTGPDRDRVWDEHLEALAPADSAALVAAVARVDPDTPPPENPAIASPEGDAWGPLRLGDMPPVEPFPDIVLPDAVFDFIRAVSDSIGCPTDFVGLATLVVAGAAIGRSASLILKPGYLVSPALYAMNVGGPSSGKSPALEAVTRPMWEIDQSLHDVYANEKAAFDRLKQEDAKPPRPALQSAVLDDVTVEAVAHHLSLNPRGLLVARDEGSAWVASIGQYKQGRGADRQFWLSALFGKPIRVDRKGNVDAVPVRVPYPFVSVIGNLPPEMLGELRERDGRSDGFLERILISFPDPHPRPHWSEQGIPEEAANDWADIVARLRGRPMAMSNDKAHPHVVRFTPEAKDAWVSWYDAHVDEVNHPDFDAGDLAVEGKLCDFAARVMLILHLLRLASDPTQDSIGPIPPVPKWVVVGALKFWSYFRSHHRRARWYMSGGIGNPDARSILEWIKRNGLESFPESELTRNFPRFRDDPEKVAEALQWIARRNGIRKATPPARPPGARGRKPGAVWMVHPSLRGSANCFNRSNDGPEATPSN